jgi:amidase
MFSGLQPGPLIHTARGGENMRSLVIAVLATTFVAPATLRAEGEEKEAPSQFNEATVAQLQAMMSSGELTSVQLTRFYLRRIEQLDQHGPGVHSVLEVNPDALSLASEADRLRRMGQVRGPLHGIPVLLKDNIDTADRMQTTAGSFALAGQPALTDSTVAAKLRAGGAVILGKTNLSEWANFRSTFSTSGWSGRGRLTHNPYSLDRNACGSSSGSAAAVAANFTAVSLGTETDGSIVCPGNVNSVVGIKPTVGLTSRGGVVPISHIQDTVGPHGRTVADAAAALGVIVSTNEDPRDPATGGVPIGWRGTGRPRPPIPTDYTQFVHADGLQGARIGVVRPTSFLNNASPQMMAAFDAAVAAIQAAGAATVNIPASAFPGAAGEIEVLLYDFKLDVASYFNTREGVPMAHKTLHDAILFNTANADIEMPFFFQEIFELADLMDTSGPNPGDNPQPLFGGRTYNQALEIDRLAGVGFDQVLMTNNVQAIVAPTDGPAWTTDLINSDHFLFASSGMAGGPGFPIVQVPAGTVLGMPVGISFIGTAFSEPTLIQFAAGFEAQTHARIVPTFAASLPVDRPEHKDAAQRQPSRTPERNLMEREKALEVHRL